MKNIEDYTEDELLELEVQKNVKASLMAGHTPSKKDIDNLRGILKGELNTDDVIKKIITEAKSNGN